MREQLGAGRRWAWLLLACCLIIPSSGVVARYMHVPGLVAYSLVTLLAAFALQRSGPTWLARAISERRALWLTLALYGVIVAAFLALYPLANSGALGGGSDRDDAINIAVSALLRRSYPYYQHTYLDNPISPLPGAFLLAAPFVMLFGSSAYQNLFWVAVFYIVVQHSYLRDRRETLLLALAVACLSPAFWQELVTGGDLLANSLYVFTFAVLASVTHDRPDARTCQRWATAVLLGIGLASRANFLLILLPVTAYISQRAGWRYASRYASLTLAVVAALVLPFYLYNPPNFTPLGAYREVSLFDSVVPHAATILIGLMILTTLALTLRAGPLDAVRFLLHCALPQSVPVILGLLVIAYARAPVYGYASFGLSFMFFGIVAAWRRLPFISSNLPLASTRK